MKKECKNLEIKIWLVSLIHILLFVIMCFNAKIIDVAMGIFSVYCILILVINLFLKLLYYKREYLATIEIKTPNTFNSSKSFFFESFKYSNFFDDYISENKYGLHLFIFIPLVILNIFIVLFYVAILFINIITPCLMFIFKYV